MAANARYSGRLLARVMALAALFLCAACGFKPLYAVEEEGGSQSLRSMHLAGVSGDEGARDYVLDAFRHRTAQNAGAARYALTIQAEESAAALAVQIDATVTRFNYRLIGEYRLVDREQGGVIRGSTTAIASFNVVNSQYATLAAERAARRKAATMLANQVERELLLRLSEGPAETAASENNEDTREIEKTDIYRDQPVDPIRQ